MREVVSFKSIFNKSLATNLLAAGIILASYFVKPQFYHQLLNQVGFFALSGAITNWLAVHMLFEKVPLLYGSGVVQNRFGEFKHGIKQLIMQQFFTEDNISKVISETISLENYEKFADHIDYDKMYHSLIEAILASPLGGMLQMVGGEQALQPVEKPIKDKLKQAITDLLKDEELTKKLMATIQEDSHKQFTSNVETIVDKHLAKLTPQMVKEIVQTMIREHLGWLVVWGGVFGGLIGLIKSFV